MNWLIARYVMLSRILAWVGIAIIIVLSVVPAVDRPSIGIGWQSFEHFTAFALVAGAFAVGYYSLSLTQLLLLAFLFCGGIELLQVPLPTRHARVSDFIIDFFGSLFAIGIIVGFNKLGGSHLLRRQRKNLSA